MVHSDRQPAAEPSPGASDDHETDDDLVGRLRAGDAAVFSGLVDDYHRMLMHLASAFVASREVAEDVVQETWLTVIASIHDFKGRPSLRSWICAIAVRRAKARARKDGRAVPFSALDDSATAIDLLVNADAATDPAWAARTPEAVLVTAETTEALERAIEELPAGLRTVLVLRDVEGLSSAETCHALGISEVNQRVSLHRARARLQRALLTILEEGA